LQAKSVLSHATKSSGERTTLTPYEMQNLSERASEDPNAQQEPHEAWSLMAWTQLGHLVLESKLAALDSETSVGSGKVVSS